MKKIYLIMFIILMFFIIPFVSAEDNSTKQIETNYYDSQLDNQNEEINTTNIIYKNKYLNSPSLPKTPISAENTTKNTNAYPITQQHSQKNTEMIMGQNNINIIIKPQEINLNPYKLDATSNAINNLNENSLEQITYFSNNITHISQGSEFKIILKTTHTSQNNKLIDMNGVPIANKNIIFTINNRIYNKITDTNGIAKLTINLNPGQYNISYYFAGDNHYSSAYNFMKLVVFKGNTYIQPISNNIYRTEQFKIALFDSNEKRLANQNIIFKINNINYMKTTDSNGIAKLTINLNPGQYNISYYFAGQNNYQSCSGESILKVSVEETTICPINLKINQGTQLNVKFTTNKGVPLSGETLFFIINGMNYNKVTDTYGIAKITINLNPGTYNIKIGYTSPNVSKYKSIPAINSNLNVFSTNPNQYSIISLSNYVVKGDTYKVKLIDSNRNPLANKIINFWINQVEYSKTTDSNGIAKITLNLELKTYVISANYGESTTTAKSYETILVTTGEMNQDYSSTSDGPLINYTISTNYQCLNNEYIHSLANNLTKNCINDLEKANAIHNYVYTSNYRDYGNGLNNAYNTALLFTGNCYDQTNLFMSLAKSSGLIVRGILGVSLNLNVGHAWAQVYLNNKWIVSDPTATKEFGSWSTTYNGDYFTNSRQNAYAFEKESYLIPIPSTID